MRSRIRGVFAPKVLIPLFAAGGLAFGTVGLLQLLERRGEAAIGFIPADAIVAVSFDNTPSPAQVPLFNRIASAMEESGLNELIDEGLLKADEGRGILKEVRSYLKGSFALGAWKTDPKAKEPQTLLALALTDPVAAENLVRRYATQHVEGGITFYRGDKQDGVVAFYYGYALLSNSEAAIRKALLVADGKEPSLFEQDSFKQARASLPSDASLMAFLNGKAIAEQDPEAKKGFEALGVDASGWFAVGISLREEGIQLDGTVPASAINKGLTAALRDMPGVTFAALRDYPAGAMGVVALSSPARIFQVVMEAVGMNPKEKAEMEKGINELEQKSGLSFQNDWLPAFRGEFNAAVYPPEQGRTEPGVILSLDNSNGGTATQTALAFFDKVNAGAFDSAIEQPRVIETTIGEFSVFRSASPRPNDEGAVLVSSNGVFVVSNQRLLDAVVSGQAAGSSLLQTSIVRSVGNSERFSLRIDLERIIGVMESRNETPPDVNLRQIITQSEMKASWSMEGNSARFTMLVPIDIPELINAIGRQAHNQRKHGK